MFRALLATGLVAVAMLAMPVPAASQEGEEDCDACAYDEGEHWFLGVICSSGGACKDCEYNPPDCIAGCHARKEEGICGQHALCAPTAPAEEDLLALVEKRDADGIAAFILEGRLRLNLKRSAIQLPGCHEDVIGHLPVPRELAQDVAEVLERAALGANGTSWNERTGS